MNPRNYKPLHIFLFLLGLGLFIYAANTGCLLDSPDEAYAPPKGFGLKGGPNVTVVTKSVFRIFTQGASYDGCERVLFFAENQDKKVFPAGTVHNPFCKLNTGVIEIEPKASRGRDGV